MKKQKLRDPKEKEIQKLIIDWLNYRKDIYFIRNNSFAGYFKRKNGTQGWLRQNKPGSPDLILCYKGQWIGIEIKTRLGKQSQLQINAMNDILRCKGKYYVIHSLEELIKKID